MDNSSSELVDYFLKRAVVVGKERNMAVVLRNAGAKISSNINVTPMVDVMLRSLIIFMVITPMLHPGVPVDLARPATRWSCPMRASRMRLSSR